MSIDSRNLIQSAGGSFLGATVPSKARPAAFFSLRIRLLLIRHVPTSAMNALKGDWRFPALGARTLSHEVNN